MKKNPIFTNSFGLVIILLIICVMSEGARKLQAFDPNCNSYNSDGSCKKCSFRFFNNTKTGFCTKVSDLCATWD
jgi:hypothetical protein